MNVLIVLAHPERNSLNGALVDIAQQELEAQGHKVQLSDLYRMNWKVAVDRKDFPNYPANEPLNVATASSQAYQDGSLPDDIKKEQEKLNWADTVIFQFPLWWFSAPAILRGWVERVFSAGYAYGNGKSYGDGVMKGKRALINVTIGGTEHDYSARGICGPIEDILFPITHGILFYTGFETLPSFHVFSADSLEKHGEGFTALTERYKNYLHNLDSMSPIPFRSAKGGDYIPETRELKPGLEPSGTTGFKIHIKPE